MDESTRQQLIDAMFRVNDRAQELVEASAALFERMSLFDQEVRGLAQVTGMLADMMPPPVAKILDVPYLSQLATPDADYAPGDCGAGCAAMLLNYLGHNVTVDDVSIQTGLPPGYHFSISTHFIKAAYHWGVSLYWQRYLSLDDLTAEIDAARPVIVLVRYPDIPDSKKYDKSYIYDHFVLLIGYDADNFYYHDPYWPDTRGRCIKLDVDTFSQVWQDVNKPPHKNSPRQATRLRS